MSKSLSDQARSISKRLSLLAEKAGVNYLNICTEFLLERMVARLVNDRSLADLLVFKGGYVALRAYNSPRFTIDLDAALRRGDIDSVSKKAIEAIQTDLEDAVWFQWEKEVSLKTLGEYGGKRLIFRTGIGPVLKDIKRAQLINLDIGIGDPIVPGPILQPLIELLGGSSLSWSIYPIETAAAEKLHTLIARGADNSRAKDVFDLSMFLEKCDSKTLKEALKQTFSFRGDALPEDIPSTLKNIDVTVLRRGWANAVGTIRPEPPFDDSYAKIIAEVKRLFS